MDGFRGWIFQAPQSLFGFLVARAFVVRVFSFVFVFVVSALDVDFDKKVRKGKWTSVR